MLQKKVLEDEREAMGVHKALLGTEYLPPYLFRDKENESLVVCLLDDGVPVGMEYGVAGRDNRIFFIHCFYAKQGYRSLEVLSDFFFDMLKTVEKNYGIVTTYWTYERGKKRDPYEKFLKVNSGYTVEKLWEVRRTMVYTKDFDYLRQFRWYHPDLLDKKGFQVKLWSEYPEAQKEKIREKQIKEKQKPDYLSPFIDNEKWESDSESSYVLVKGEAEEPCGWILCEKISDDAVKLRRFYIYEEIRKIRLGPAFSTYALDRISEKFDIMVFDVAVGNSQMERVMLRQFGPITVQSCYISNTKIQINQIKED
ncbi:hypothetical protein PMF13cell1_00314 [Blautia producta]|uniref:Uncharacterized protein n=1 Tax=Blautia producta TaxID=33035 RepID=A0A4P6LRP9_9FIRM|nr:hypothetical protein [Blautia producta]QBE94821.1 hypothetical protein PMF13cell1_00314 [Blautia producta]